MEKGEVGRGMGIGGDDKRGSGVCLWGGGGGEMKINGIGCNIGEDGMGK